MKKKVIWYVATGAVAGAASGFLGIGGGIVLVPMMVALLGMAEHKAHGTSLAVIMPIAVVGTIVYALRGHIDWTLAVVISAGGIIGVIAGAKLMTKLSDYRLRQLFGIYAIAIATLMLIR